MVFTRLILRSRCRDAYSGLAQKQLLQSPRGPKGLCMNNAYHSLCFLRLLLFQTETDTKDSCFAKADRLSTEANEGNEEYV